MTWDQQIEIAQTADRLGMEAMVPVGRWTGFRGNTNFNGVCFETYTWAAGLAQATENIGIFTTSHVPTVHPIVGAKMATTIDHISGGRYGMNLVMGWFTPEMELFGRQQLPHDERYEYGQEWIDFVEKLWTEHGDFDVEGKHFTSKGRARLPQADPGTARRRCSTRARHPPGRSSRPATSTSTSSRCRSRRRRATSRTSRPSRPTSTSATSTSGPTASSSAARPRRRPGRRTRRSSTRATGRARRSSWTCLGIESASFGTQIKQFQERFIAGWGGPNLIGTPQQVAEQFAEFSNAGLGGAIFGFLDYAKELKEFGAEVMPILRKAGLRH